MLLVANRLSSENQTFRLRKPRRLQTVECCVGVGLSGKKRPIFDQQIPGLIASVIASDITVHLKLTKTIHELRSLQIASSGV